MNSALVFVFTQPIYVRLADTHLKAKGLIRIYGKDSNQTDCLRSCMQENGKKLTAVVSGQMRKD